MSREETEELFDQLEAIDWGQEPVLGDAAVTRLYRGNRSSLRRVVRRMKSISMGTGGILSTGNQMFWGSVLFTRLAVMARSIQESTPEPKPRQHWDFSALASLVRNFAECYFVFYFLCVDSVDEDERQARFLMMHLHDNFSRHRMLKELGADGDDSENFEANRSELEERIRKTIYFSKQSEKRQNAILKGDRTPFIQDEILDRIGFDKQIFRGLYRLLSSHTHTGPIAFYRMSDLGRGTGVENRSDKVYMTIVIGLAIEIAQRACMDILTIFPNAEKRGAKLNDSNLSKHLQDLKDAQLRGETIPP